MGMILIILATLSVATGGILFEIFLGAFGSYLFGDSVKVFSLTSGLYMFSMGVGAFAIRPPFKNVFYKILLIEFFLLSLHLLSPFLIWTAFAAGWGVSVIFWSVLLISGVLVGTEIPLLLAYAKEWEEGTDSRIHQILAADYLGALLASIAFGFYLLPKVGLIGTAAVAAFAEGLGMLFLLLARMSTLKGKRDRALFGWLALSIVGIALTVGCYVKAPKLQFWLESHWVKKWSSGAALLHSEWSGIQHITILKKEDVSKPTQYTLLLDGKFQWSTLGNLTEYHDYLTIPAAEVFIKNNKYLPKRALILGGGDGFGAYWLRRYYALSHIDVIDIDIRMKELALQYKFWKDAGGKVYEMPGVNYYPEDAFSFLRTHQGDKYDLIIMDLPIPRSPAIARLYTPMFLNFLKERLSPKGIILIQTNIQVQSPGGQQKFICSLQNNFNEMKFTAIPLEGTGQNYYLMAAAKKWQWPSSDKKLPGTFLTSGQELQNMALDVWNQYSQDCPSLTRHSMLQPTILSY